MKNNMQKTKMKANRTIPALFALFACAAASAQTEYKSRIEPVSQSGYYNIELSPEITALSGLSFRNLRIRDAEGMEVPCFVRSETPVRETDAFVEYPLAGNTTRDSLNIITVANPGRGNLSRFCLVITSADVQKYASLRGSNDRRQWYVVKQREDITYSGYKHGNEEYLLLNFPQGDYAYYEIQLSNTQESPLNVIKVGRFENSTLYSQLAEIDLGRFIQKDSSDKRTYLYFPDPAYGYWLSKLEFEIEYKGEYLRNGSVGSSYGAKFELSSRGDNSFYIPATSLSPGMPVVIMNRDNPPLKITSIRAYGLNRYLCAYLEQEKHYTVEINDAWTSRPDYDIERIAKEILQKDMATIKTAGLEKYVAPPREKRWLEKPLFLWSAIGLVGLFLAFLCWKVLAEMKKR